MVGFRLLACQFFQHPILKKTIENMIFACTHIKLDLVGRGKNNFPLFSMFGLEVKEGKKKKIKTVHYL